MIALRAYGREVLVAGTLTIFLLLAVIALWIHFHPGPTPAAPKSGNVVPAIPRNQPVPVFSVAPTYGAAPPLTATQALFRGRVVDSGTMGPLPGAELDIDQAGGLLHIHTDSEGVYMTPVETSRPFSFTVTAARHVGGGGYGRLCAGDRSDITVAIAPIGGAPAAPMVIQGSCRQQP